MIFLNNKDEIVFSKNVDLDSRKEFALPDSFSSILSKKPFFISHKDVKSSYHGILVLPEGPVLISTRPIVTSKFEGPIRGCMIVGKYLNKTAISQLSDITKLSISLDTIGEVQSFQKFYNLSKIKPHERQIFISTKNKNIITGYTLMFDMFQKPGFIIKVETNREIYQQSLISKIYFISLLIAACFMFGFTTFWLLEKVVLAPSNEQEVLLNTIPALAYLKDTSSKYITVNKRFEEMFNITKNEIKGKTDFDLFSKKQAKEFQSLDNRVISSGIPTYNYEAEIILPNGNKIWTSSYKSPYVTDEGATKGIVGIILDTTEQKIMKEKLYHTAYYDSLTNLPNRTLFAERINESLSNFDEDEKKVSILFIDIDRFKIINDTLGHSVGDEFLKEIAKRLEDCIGEKGMVARLGGDEFAILVNSDNKEYLSRTSGLILSSVQNPWIYEDHKFYVTASIGISIYPSDGKDFTTLLKNADTAMYNAKEQGKNNYQFYTSTLSALALEELSLENGLRNALKRNEFKLYYQPQIDIRTGKIIGIEALLRWHHPKEGIIPPYKFIPCAENCGLIIPIGEWVLQTACCQNKLWQDSGLPPVRISVNLSARQLQQNCLIQMFKRILDRSGLNPKWLEIELTESMIMKDPKTSLLLLEELKAMGIKIALDDFGTGYSSLMYLKKFPIDNLKIDKSFIFELNSNAEDATIVRTIINLAKNLNLNVTAEGVETHNQFEFLKREGCDYAQGYLISKPVPDDEIVHLLK